MRHRRKKWVGNWFLVFVLVVLIGLAVYVNQVVIPTVPPPLISTPTATRDPESYIVEAEDFFKQGKLLQAIDVYTEAVRADPNDSAIYVALARVQVFAGEYEEALTNTGNALLLNSNNAMAMAVRGWALTQQEEYLQAESSIKDSLQLDANNGIAHAYYAELLGDMYLNNIGPLDTIDQAIEESRVAVSLAPNTIESHWARGFILEITNNREEAVREYEAAIAINSNIPALHLDLGRTYSALEVLDRAVQEYTLANTLNPSDPLPDLYLSRTYSRIGEFAKAAQYAEQAVKDDPTDPYLRGNWGWTLYKSLKWDPALTQFSLAINGGLTEDGLTIQPLELTTDDIRVVQYFYTYAYMLAISIPPRCDEAVLLAQQLLDKARNDEIAVYNAQETIRICEESLLTPAAGPTSTPRPNQP